jgi:hypothetical protein
MNIFLLDFSRNTEFRNQVTKCGHNITEENEKWKLCLSSCCRIKTRFNICEL